MTELLENIKSEYSKKIIISLCNKLQKKCSFNSENDIRNLKNLVFWLYILGDTENSRRLIDLTANVVFNGKYNIWDYIHGMWALKARILREKGDTAEAQKIIGAIIANDLTPNKYITTFEEMRNHRADQIKRTTYEGIGYKEKIESDLSDGDVNGANIWRFGSMVKYIRYKEEGVYPDLIEKDDLIEKEIQEFIEILRNA